MSYGNWYLVELTPEAAEAHDRRAYNAEDPAIQLGWKPYTYRASRGAVSQFACHTEEQLKVWLAARGLKVAGWTDWHNDVRQTRLVPR